MLIAAWIMYVVMDYVSREREKKYIGSYYLLA